MRFFSMCNIARANSNKNLLDLPALRKNKSKAENEVSIGIPQVNRETNHPIKHYTSSNTS